MNTMKKKRKINFNTFSTFNRIKYPELILFDWIVLLGKKANATLEGFLSVVINEEVKIIIIKRSMPNDAKDYRSDLLVENKHGELFIIELHCCEESDYYFRIVHDPFQATFEHIMNGEPYSKIRKIYHIKIVNFKLGEGKDYVYRGITEFRGIHHNDALQLTDKEKYFLKTDHTKDICEKTELTSESFLICIKNFDETTVQEVNNNLDEWMCYLKYHIIPQEFTAPGLKKAVKQLRYGNLSGREKLNYDHFGKQLRHDRSIMNTAIFKGKYEGNYEAERSAKNAAGLKNGETIREAQIRAIKNIYRTGLYSIDAIAIIMGGTAKQIIEILKQHGIN
jgi:predicted transposase/invertase (TIGR01784 family)